MLHFQTNWSFQVVKKNVLIDSLYAQRWEIPWEDIVIHRDETGQPLRLGAGATAFVLSGSWNHTKVAVKMLTASANLQELRKEVIELSHCLWNCLCAYFILRLSFLFLIVQVTLLSAMRHPNIVEFLGACTTPPNLCILTALMRHGSLSDCLVRELVYTCSKVLLLIAFTAQ